jgi:hypothetical protein
MQRFQQDWRALIGRGWLLYVIGGLLGACLFEHPLETRPVPEATREADDESPTQGSPETSGESEADTNAPAQTPFCVIAVVADESKSLLACVALTPEAQLNATKVADGSTLTWALNSKSDFSSWLPETQSGDVWQINHGVSGQEVSDLDVQLQIKVTEQSDISALSSVISSLAEFEPGSQQGGWTYNSSTNRALLTVSQSVFDPSSSLILAHPLVEGAAKVFSDAQGAFSVSLTLDASELDAFWLIYIPEQGQSVAQALFQPDTGN